MTVEIPDDEINAEGWTMEAVAANQAKDEFIATLAHEVRTPLSTISTATH